jgi:hypothetical protein
VNLIRPVVLVLAALMAAPAIWLAAVDGKLDLNSALMRFLIAVPVAIAMVGGLRLLTAEYRHKLAAEVLPEEKLAESATQRLKEVAAKAANTGAEPIRRRREQDEDTAAA